MKKAFVKSIPILCSYFFVSMAYGMMMEEAGYHWYVSLFASLTIYTGAFQYVLITFLAGGTSLVTIALTAFLMNSRQFFYSLSYVDEFSHMGRKKWYMVHTMTDETYAVNNTIEESPQKKTVLFFLALYSRCYWMIGTVAGGLVGALIPFELEGIDFCMTALFVIIFIDQWEKAKQHHPALLGIGVGILCLFIFGQQYFMLPALLIVSGILLFIGSTGREAAHE